MGAAQPVLVSDKVAISHRELVSGRLAFDTLSPLLRTLLTTDGTVTEVLSAYYGEAIGIRVLAQSWRDYEGRSHRELEAALGTRMLDRSIALYGKQTGATYAAASSRIIPGLLPLGMQEALLAEREPLGKLMLTHRLETFKEMLACDHCRAADAPLLKAGCAEALQVTADAPVVWRTYRVISGGRPMMSISEFFPEALS